MVGKSFLGQKPNLFWLNHCFGEIPASLRLIATSIDRAPDFTQAAASSGEKPPAFQALARSGVNPNPYHLLTSSDDDQLGNCKHQVTTSSTGSDSSNLANLKKS